MKSWQVNNKNLELNDKYKRSFNKLEEIIYTPLLRPFANKLLSDDPSIKSDFNEILLHIFYNSPFSEKILKQWSKQGVSSKSSEFKLDANSDPFNASDIFLDYTWKNYILDHLKKIFMPILNKLSSGEEITPGDFETIFSMVDLIDTILFAVVLDFYIIGRMLKSYVYDNIILYVGLAHYTNYISILTEKLGFVEKYSIVADDTETEIPLLYIDDNIFTEHFASNMEGRSSRCSGISCNILGGHKKRSVTRRLKRKTKKKKSKSRRRKFKKTKKKYKY